MIDLGTMTTEQLADAYRAVNDQKKDIEATLAAMKEEFTARGFGGGSVILGETTELKIRVDTPWVLDTKRVKEEMGEAWYTAHSSISTRVVFAAKERKVASSALIAKAVG